MCVYRCDFFICYFVVAVMRSVIRYLQCYGIVRCFLLSLQIVSSTILLILLCITNFRRVSCFLDLVTKRGHGVQLFALLAGSSRTTISLLPFALTSSPLHHPSVPPSIPKKNKYTHTHIHTSPLSPFLLGAASTPALSPRCTAGKPATAASAENPPTSSVVRTAGGHGRRQRHRPRLECAVGLEGSPRPGGGATSQGRRCGF